METLNYQTDTISLQLHNDLRQLTCVFQLYIELVTSKLGMSNSQDTKWHDKLHTLLVFMRTPSYTIPWGVSTFTDYNKHIVTTNVICLNSTLDNKAICCKTASSSRMGVINHNWSATKQRLHPQSLAEISRHSVLSGDRIPQCGTSSGSRHNDTDQCL